MAAATAGRRDDRRTASGPSEPSRLTPSRMKMEAMCSGRSYASSGSAAQGSSPAVEPSAGWRRRWPWQRRPLWGGSVDGLAYAGVLIVRSITFECPGNLPKFAALNRDVRHVHGERTPGLKAYRRLHPVRRFASLHRPHKSHRHARCHSRRARLPPRPKPARAQPAPPSGGSIPCAKP